MKKTLAFITGLVVATLIGTFYNTFFQNKPTILPNPFSIESEKEKIDKISENIASSTATSTIH